MSTHRQGQVRPRYGRIGLAATSLGVTVLAVLGGLGALPSAAQSDQARTPQVRADRVALSTAPQAPVARGAGAGVSGTADRSDRRSALPTGTALPEDSGHGRRVVFSESQQRVWLVAKGRVQRTYLVSGSVYDNLDPGSYEVYSRSEQAWGIDDSGTMKYFVRFAHGDNAAIGFHDIPVDDGEKVQTVDELGTPQSHGCIRQRRKDAIALWEFAPIGTTVVVTA